MTVIEFIDLICTKLHRTDVETREEARQYLSMRYKMIWNSRPWRDTLNLLSLATSSNQVIICPNIMDRVICVRWGTDQTLDPETLITMFLTNPSEFNNVSSPSNFNIISPSAVAVSPAGAKLNLVSDDATAAFTVSIRGIRGTDEKYETVAIAGAGTTTTINEYDEVFSLAKDSTENALTVKSQLTMATLLTLETHESSRMHPRIHLFVTPSEAKTQFMIFKRKVNRFVVDSDSTEIAGIDNGLLAAAECDMYEGQRQFAKAAAKGAEAGAIIQAMTDLETHQSANMPRLIPWDASGDDSWEGLGGKGYL